MQCVILAGGLGTRMQPLTNAYPKSLIEVCGRPFVHHQLSWLAAHGVTQALFCIGYRGEMLKSYVGDGQRWSIVVRYVDEGSQLRGTAGALRLAFEAGALEPSFLLTYGDSFLPIDFAQVYSHFLRVKQPALMCVYPDPEGSLTNNAIYRSDSGSVELYDKHHATRPAREFRFIDYGLSALRREVVRERIPSGEVADLADLFFRLSQAGELAGFLANERYFEIGSFAGLLALETSLKVRSPCTLAEV